MSFEQGLILAFVIVGFGEAALAGFAIWLYQRGGERRNRDNPKHT